MTITHDSGTRRFLALDDAGNQIGFLSYSGDNPTITAEHTVVDKAHRGQGIARALLDAITQYAEANNLTIRPQCSYVKAAFAKEPERFRAVAAE